MVEGPLDLFSLTKPAILTTDAFKMSIGVPFQLEECPTTYKFWPFSGVEKYYSQAQKLV